MLTSAREGAYAWQHAFLLKAALTLYRKQYSL